MKEPTNSPASSRSAHGQRALPREYVTCDAIYARETERVFSNHWLYVGHQSELESESACLRVSVRGSQRILVKSGDGSVKAFHNFCRHRGSELVNEKNCQSLGNRIQCPYHAWTYDRSGRLVSAPNMPDDKFDKSQFGLKEVACANWNGFLFVRFDSKASGKNTKSVEDFMLPLNQHAQDWDFAKLKIAETIVYDVAANWKLIFQNYSECYHCPVVHPALNRLTPYQGASNDLDEGPILGGPMQLAEGCETMSDSGKAVGGLLPGLSPEQARSVAYYTVFPSFFLSAHPDYVLIHRIIRVSARQTKVVCQFLFHPDSIPQPGFDPKPAVEFWDLTNKQDWEVCELAQRGMADIAYQPGPYSNLESVVAAFDRNYFEAMK